jgi:hypothetical protein
MPAPIEIPIPQSDGWDFSDFDPSDHVVGGLVMALEGCGDEDTPVAVVRQDNRKPLRIFGVRVAVSGQVQIVVGVQA